MITPASAIKSNVQYFPLLLLVAVTWSSSYLFMRIAGPVLGSVVLIGLRVSIAALVLLVYVFFTGTRPDFRAYWKQFLLLGLLNNVIPFILNVNSVIDLNSSIAAILNATTPLFTALVAAAAGAERLNLRKSIGIVAGIGGVVALMGLSPLPITSRVVLAVLQSLLAALLYGCAAVYARKRFQNISPLHTTLGQLIGASVILLPVSVFMLPPVVPDWPVIGAVLGLALICTVAAYLIFFRLIATAGPTRSSTVSFLVPFFSLVWGVVLLKEPLNLGIFLGLGIILFSVWLVLGARD